MKSAALFLIHAYRALLSGVLGPCCRFEPSCSHYAEEAFEKKSFFAALALTIKRIFKCHPGHPGGWDPVER